MPTFFSFQQGTESRARPSVDTSPLLGRFRAVPGQRRQSLLGKRDSILASLGDSVGYGYGSLFRTRSHEEGEGGDGGLFGDSDGGGGWALGKKIKDVWIEPKQSAVRKVVDWWWKRWGVLFVLPAAIVGFSILVAL